MTDKSELHTKAMDFLLKTSRTFFIPISYLPKGLQEGIGAAYLCMRAIDEIEDHPSLPTDSKVSLLQTLSELPDADFKEENLQKLFEPYKDELPEVTLFLSDWVEFCPPGAIDKVLESTKEMAEGMAKWVTKDWQIHNEEELDDYTYYVAGLVGVMLSDMWNWYDGTETDRELAIAFGRGLQTVNILRNREEDAERGVNFYPDGWGFDEMLAHTEHNLALADAYIEEIETKEIIQFCKIPLELAKATLKALKEGKEKIDRATVTEIVSQVVEH
ncbi:phytoene/squalene synthase family protein [Peribacillus frigoritolerans]|uniref:phytoene/squalene synthase family protein n=1 Tax=Peribacillus frigoritolerans TaxID=450367 RepID=UPI0024C0F79B|nr:phytoene/squalene synthase family protein [Peribacillus frigoritolerans]WHX60290.1 phytoene/squalene synthase family protein [Peribacillus frigoritolerans]